MTLAQGLLGGVLLFAVRTDRPPFTGAGFLALVEVPGDVMFPAEDTGTLRDVKDPASGSLFPGKNFLFLETVLSPQCKACFTVCCFLQSDILTLPVQLKMALIS